MRVKREWITFALFVAPNVVLFAAFTYWPIVYGAYLSLLDWRLPSPVGEFFGLDNYARLIRDETFWRVVRNTVVYAVEVVAAAQALAFGLALLLNQRVPGRALFRTIAFMPYVTTTAAAALVWVLLLDPRYGPLAPIYDAAEMDGPRWMSSSALALWAIVIVGIWREIGIATVFYVTGLQNLPESCYEAASIDGAGAWMRLTRLTVPLISPVIFFLGVSGFIAAVKVFDTVAIMTEGGPVYPASSTLVYHLYQVGFRDYRIGYASCMAVVMFVALLGVTALQLRWARRWVHYGS